MKSTDNWSLPQYTSIHFQNYGLLPSVLEKLLQYRGYFSKESIQEYLFPKELPLADEHFPGLQKAVNRLENACKSKEEVAICGDYDADGMTSTALLTNVLNSLGAQAKPIIPSREEDGYGLNVNMIQDINKQGVKLIITVDNGVSAFKPLEEAKRLGIDVILTDHHLIKKRLDCVFALIHPETTPDNSPYKVLAGVGLAYILASELCNKIGNTEPLGLARDLFCIGTIADMSLLKEANRLLIKSWINKINYTKSIGLRALLAKAKIDNLTVSSEDISFKIAPRINSIGRLSDPKLILDLFLEKDQSKAEYLVQECENINKNRKNLVEATLNEAMTILSKDNLNDIFFIFIAQSHWHKGIIGLVASRIMDNYKKPTAILTSDSEGLFRGSIRSPSGFNVVKALDSCSDYLDTYGGHAAAGGFTVKALNLTLLQNQLNKIAKLHFDKEDTTLLKPEVFLNLSDIDEHFLDKLKLFEPFGIGNPKPLFWTREVEVLKQFYLNQKHLSLSVKQNNSTFKAFKWNSNISFINDRKIDIVFNIDKSNYNNKSEYIINIKALKPFRKVETFFVKNRKYNCSIENKKLKISNSEGNCKKYYIEDIEGINNKYMKKLAYISMSILGISPS